MVLTVIALVIMGIFYAIYFGKMLLQKKKGIKTDQIAESQIHNVEFYTEAVMKAATICVVVVEIASVLLGWSLFPVWGAYGGGLYGCGRRCRFWNFRMDHEGFLEGWSCACR